MEHKDMVGKIFKNNAGLEFKVNKFLYKKKTHTILKYSLLKAVALEKRLNGI